MNIITVACPGEQALRTYELSPQGLREIARTDMGADVSVVVPAGPASAWVRLKDPHRVALLERRGDGWAVVAETAAPASLNHLAPAADGAWLLGVSYGGGQVCAWPLDARGVPGECRVVGQGLHPHSVVTRGEVAHVAFLGEDAVATYRLGDEGWEEVSRAAAPEGSGPRHQLLSEDGAQLWCVSEFSGEVLHWHRSPQGELTWVGATSAFDPEAGLSHSWLGVDPLTERLIWGADLHQCGQSLIASERTASTLAFLPLAADGTVQPAASFTPAPTQPRGFAVTEDLVVCAGEKAGDVVVFRAEGHALTEVARAACGKGANWVAVW